LTCEFYIGSTGTGKTTLALEHLGRDIKSNGHPALVIDSQGVSLLKGIPHYTDWKKAARRVFHDRKNVAFIPNDPAEVSAFFDVARSAGSVNLLIDEGAFWMSWARLPRSIELGFRTHLHTGITIRTTTQCLTDVHGVTLQCAGALHIFRCTSPRILKRLESEYGIDPKRVQALRVGESILHKM